VRDNGAGAYTRCQLCPRGCGVDRTCGQRGYCGETAELRVAAAVIHRGEEPPVTGNGGSGAVFISGCNLGCVFCQNYQISHTGSGSAGSALSIEGFARLCLSLERAGAENINIVTGSHAIPAIVAGLKQARTDGLSLPILWNSSAYESIEALALLDDVVSVYLPDLKTLDSALAARYFNAPDYPQQAANAILRMLSCQPELLYEGTALKAGVIVRHLVLPGHLDATHEVLRWFAEHCSGAGNGAGRALLSLMTQYTPIERAQSAPAGFVTEREYDTVVGWLEELGIDDGFVQDLLPDTGWLPDFSKRNPFASTLSTPVWHWSTP
jgi:putative pyruvate formate lyase activating enzyme